MFKIISKFKNYPEISGVPMSLSPTMAPPAQPRCSAASWVTPRLLRVSTSPLTHFSLLQHHHQRQYQGVSLASFSSSSSWLQDPWPAHSPSQICPLLWVQTCPSARISFLQILRPGPPPPRPSSGKPSLGRKVYPQLWNKAGQRAGALYPLVE